MNFDEIFEAYYTQYRLEADIPNDQDDEYKIGMRLANEAINKWQNYDGVYWNELFSTNMTSDNSGDQTVTTDTEYAAPGDMREAGGYVWLSDPTTKATVERIPIIKPQEAQFKSDLARYCYFTGNPNSGFTLHLNPSPDTADLGCNIEYVYYKQATKMTDGTSVPEMADPYFMVHRMLANRFRGSRNPYYSTAKNEAENALRIMQADNISGSWANPWKLQDNSGTRWGM